jgi:hypothetical protein
MSCNFVCDGVREGNPQVTSFLVALHWLSCLAMFASCYMNDAHP